jgi:hypothetical protein
MAEEVKKKKQPGKTASALLTTKGSTGVISWFKRQTRLGFRENKDIVYKAQVVRGPVVKGDDLIAYAANAAHVPASTIRQAKNAIFDAVAYFCTQGHPVQIPRLGTLCPRSTSKTAHTLEETTLDTLTGKKLIWKPKKEVADLGRYNNISFRQSKNYTYLACPEAAPTPDDGD